jgi:ATP-dependent 26S proteasome regulatory subunit
LAKEKAPAIIFIDELDAIGTKVWEQFWTMADNIWPAFVAGRF